MHGDSSLNIRHMVFASLFTALITIGGYISFPIPFSPVPVVLADFFVMLAGLTLGLSWGVASVALFLFLGAIGLPVLAGGSAGFANFIGPTGGFLFGYLLGVWAIGLISDQGQPSWIKDIVALVAGNVGIFGLGIPWLKLILGITWGKAVALGLLPFLPGNIVKMVVAFTLIQTVRPIFKQFVAGSQDRESA